MDARLGDLRGPEALYLSLSLPGASFNFNPLVKPPEQTFSRHEQRHVQELLEGARARGATEVAIPAAGGAVAPLKDAHAASISRTEQPADAGLALARAGDGRRAEQALASGDGARPALKAFQPRARRLRRRHRLPAPAHYRRASPESQAERNRGHARRGGLDGPAGVSRRERRARGRGGKPTRRRRRPTAGGGAHGPNPKGARAKRPTARRRRRRRASSSRRSRTPPRRPPESRARKVRRVARVPAAAPSTSCRSP